MIELFKLEIEPIKILHTKWGNASIDKDHGYYRIVSKKEGNKGKILHRLIFEDFYGPIPEGCVIHHKDEDKTNNCIMNLQIMSKKQHMLHHKVGWDRNVTLREKIEFSRKWNITGYFRVYKSKCKTCEQGFYWKYQYWEDGKGKSVNSVDLDKLEQKVKEKGLPWIVL